MTAVLDLSGAPDIGLSGWLVPLRSGVVRDPSRAVRLPDKPGDVLAIGRSARLSSRRTPQRTVTVTALVLDDDRTPPQVSGDHAEIELVEEGAWCLRHNSKTAGSFINEGPPLLATNSPGMGPRMLQHGDKLRFGGGIRGTGLGVLEVTLDHGIARSEGTVLQNGVPYPKNWEPTLTFHVDLTEYGIDVERAWVGFTASTSDIAAEHHDIRSFSFCERLGCAPH